MNKGKVKTQPSSDATSVTNLSKHELSAPHLSLLEKGLKFIPSRHEVDKVKLLADLSEWERRMRLAEYFNNRDDDTKEQTKDAADKFMVKKKSTFTLNAGRDKCLDLYIDLVKDDVMGSLKKSKKINLTKEENSAFHELLHNDGIIIRPADKGSGIVVIDKEEYIESLEEMEQSSAYERTDNDRTEEAHKKVKKFVNKMNRDGLVSDDLKNYLTPKYVQRGKLKGNPKLHKANAPYRAIVSGIGTPTERLAELAEHELKGFVEQSPSYIRDTTDFIVKLRSVDEPLPTDAILFCFDVVKLYPSVPRKEGLQACEEALSTRLRSLVSGKAAMEMIQTVLDNNVFGFGDKSAYMRKWDEALLRFRASPYFYKRFIDDGFGIWTEGEDELKLFAKHANSINPNIQVELPYDRKQIEFLDTLVKLEDGHIYSSK